MQGVQLGLLGAARIVAKQFIESAGQGAAWAESVMVEPLDGPAFGAGAERDGVLWQRRPSGALAAIWRVLPHQMQGHFFAAQGSQTGCPAATPKQLRWRSQLPQRAIWRR